MIVNPLFEAAETVLGVQAYPTTYDAEMPTDKYIVYEYLDERVQLYADDEDAYDMTNIRVHWYLTDGVQKAKKDLRRFLRKQGFVIVATGEDYDESTNLWHITVDADIGGYINDEEEI